MRANNKRAIHVRTQDCKNLVSCKRSQSEVITTVLIILLVLAAVFIVWTAVRGMINKGTQQAANKAQCLEISLVLSGLACNSSTQNITGLVSRDSDQSGNMQMKLIAGNNVGNAVSAPVSMGSLSFSIMGASGTNQVRVAAVLDGVACDPIPPTQVIC